MIEYDELTRLIEDYQSHGYTDLVNEAIGYARKTTRDYIERTHPRTAFGGKNIVKGNIIRGKFEIEAHEVNLNIYADYLARWYNTGTYGKAPRGRYFNENALAIETYFANQVSNYLKQHISL